MRQEFDRVLGTPTWVKCEVCEEPYCILHEAHAADCPCAGIDTWAEHELSPYATPIRDLLSPAARQCVVGE